PEEGSSFFFTIKTRPATADEIPDGSNAANQLANATVLLVSDNREEANTYSSYLKRWGMKVQATDNAEAAMQLVKDNGIDLIAIDAQMITAKALVVAQQVRRIAPKDELPIILFNAGHDDITIEF